MGTQVSQTGKMKSFTCPRCGWMVKSPFGEYDVAEIARAHVELHHPELAYISKERIMTMEKDA